VKTEAKCVVDADNDNDSGVFFRFITSSKLT
jgi:hypothetical protein